MILINAPDYTPIPFNAERIVFLAGGISGCSDWQKEVIEHLSYEDDTYIVLNPRREGTINRKDRVVSDIQIDWEYRYLRLATDVLFWFPPSSICPITLFELGGALERRAYVHVGCDPNYDRRLDLEIQIEKSRRNIKIKYSLAELVADISTNTI